MSSFIFNIKKALWQGITIFKSILLARQKLETKNDGFIIGCFAEKDQCNGEKVYLKNLRCNFS